MNLNSKDRYQVRAAAGKYWLLDMEQKAGQFRTPVAMNETGAMIWEYFRQTRDLDKTAACLAETYEIEKEEALSDVKAFLEQLRRQGIDW